MRIICAGLSKTGTSSIAEALRILGFTVFDWPEHEAIHGDEWLVIYLRGKSPDFVSMYNGVNAVTDLPAMFWYQEISETFPNGKVVLTIRDSEDDWLKSWVREKELEQNLTGCRVLVKILFRCCFYRKVYAEIDAMDSAAFGSLNPESTVLFKKKYREHNKRVQAVIPAKKLLVFNVKQGWRPLCNFLGCEIPGQNFPYKNAGSNDSLKTLTKRKRQVAFNVIVILATLSFFSVQFTSLRFDFANLAYSKGEYAFDPKVLISVYSASRFHSDVYFRVLHACCHLL